MIFEVDQETRDFVTTYKKDYYSKRTKKVQKYLQSPNYTPPLNALNGPFHEHLNSLRKNDSLPPEERTEDIRDNLKRVRSKYPHLQKILPDTSPDEKVIETKQKKSFKTIYQLEYSRNLDDYISLRTQRTGGDKTVELPNGWIIPETVNRSYRDPRDLSRFGLFLGRRKIFKPSGNLDRDKSEMLQIIAGNSEYADVIGRTGDRILKEQLHGIPIPLDPPSSRLKAPDIISSRCYSMAPETPFISNIF